MLIMQKNATCTMVTSFGRPGRSRKETCLGNAPGAKKTLRMRFGEFFILYVHIPKMQKSQNAQNRGLGCSNPGAGPWGGSRQLGLRFVALSGF